MKREDVKKGAILRYHPVIGREPFVRVEIVDEPWTVCGDIWICKARGVDDGHIYRPAVKALSPDETDPAEVIR